MRHGPAPGVAEGPRADLGGQDADRWLLRYGPGVEDRGRDARPRHGAAAARVGLVVLGMHRSGTSAMARLFNLLGCALPATLMPARAGNEAGHWESEAVCAFNDSVLDSAGSHWADWDAVNPQWYRAPAYADWVARGRDVLRAEFARAPLFVMKDPRQCRLARFWLDVLASEQVAPRVVLALRHPWEVARSLQWRDGMGAGRAHLLWLGHMLAAEAGSRGLVRAVCGYDRLMACRDAGAVAGLVEDLGARLGVAWPRVSARAMEEVACFLDPAARHHSAQEIAGEAGQALIGWAGRVHAILSRWSQAGEVTADHAELDAIADAMARAGPDLARLIAREEGLDRALAAAREAGEQGREQAEARVAQVREDLAEALAALEQERAAAARQERGLEEAQGRVWALQAAQAEGQAALQAAVARLAVVEAELAGQNAAARARDSAHKAVLAEREAGLIELGDLRDDLMAERLALIARIEVLEAAAEKAGRDARARVAVLRERLEDSEGAQGALADRLAEAERWVWRLAGERHGLEREVARAERRLATSERAAAQATGRERRLELALSQARASMEPGAHVGARVAEQIAEQGAQLAALSARAVAAEGALAEHKARAETAGEEAAMLSARLIAAEQAGEAAREALACGQAAAQGEIDAMRRQAEDMRRQAEDLRRQAEDMRQQAEDAQRQGEHELAERYREIATLTAMLREQVETGEQRAAEAAWMRALWQALRRAPWWARWRWALGRVWPQGWLARRGLFDAAAYRARHGDVAASGIDPLDHYIAHGMGEGRMMPAGQV